MTLRPSFAKGRRSRTSIAAKEEDKVSSDIQDSRHQTRTATGNKTRQETQTNPHPSAFDNTSAPKPGQQSSYLAPPPSSASASSKRYLWSIHFYQQFFDLTTTQLLTRLYNTFRPDRNFLDTLDGNPDLYGPVWISTTVVVILFLTGTISQYLAEKGEQHFVYDWRLLSGAAGLVYGFNLVVPAALWGVLKWFAGRGSGLGEDGREVLGLVESWCLYGYASLVWVVVALVSWSPLSGEFVIFLPSKGGALGAGFGERDDGSWCGSVGRAR